MVYYLHRYRTSKCTYNIMQLDQDLLVTDLQVELLNVAEKLAVKYEN